jgi:hypothetical protein
MKRKPKPAKSYTWGDYVGLACGGNVTTVHYNGGSGSGGGCSSAGGGGGYSIAGGGGGASSFAAGGVVAAGGYGGNGGWYSPDWPDLSPVGWIEPDGLAPMINYDRHE